MYKTFLSESSKSIEKKVIKLIRENGYAVFTDLDDTKMYVTEVKNGYGYGVTSYEDSAEVNLNGKDINWDLIEGTGVADIAGTGDGFNKKMHRKSCKHKNKNGTLNDTMDCDALSESPVGAVGRTGYNDAKLHVTPELRQEFKKIVKRLGGKTVAKELLSQMNGQVTERYNKWEGSIQNLLIDVLDGEVDRVDTFEEAGLLTRDAGVVIKNEGKTYQITILEV
jgi:hypothetical protein